MIGLAVVGLITNGDFSVLLSEFKSFENRSPSDGGTALSVIRMHV